MNFKINVFYSETILLESKTECFSNSIPARSPFISPLNNCWLPLLSHLRLPDYKFIHVHKALPSNYSTILLYQSLSHSFTKRKALLLTCTY